MLDSLRKYTRRIYKRELKNNFLNIICLSVGMACSLVLGLHLFNELTYDRHFAGHENIYRVASEATDGSSSRHLAQIYFQVGRNLATDNPEVLDYVSFSSLASNLFRVNDQSFFWNDTYSIEGDAFDIFTVEPVYGDSGTALDKPNSAAVSESFARAYFGNGNPLGQVITSQANEFEITFVYRDLPENTHLKFDVLVNREPVDTTSEAFRMDYIKGGPMIEASDYTYVRTRDGFKPGDFGAISSRYVQTYLERFSGMSSAQVRYYLEPLSAIHYRSITERDLPRGNIFSLYSFTGIVLLVLAVSCANYVNFSISAFEHRSKEVTMRQVLGAGRLDLFLRHFLETQALAFVSMLIALLFVVVVRELFPLDRILGGFVATHLLLQPSALAILAVGTFVIGTLAGAYPAVEQARSSLGHLGQKLKSAHKRIYVRFALLFLQLTVSIGVISTALLMHSQIEFVQSTPLGFDEKNKLIVEIRGAQQISRLPVLLDSLNSQSSIASATYAENMPGHLSDVITMFGQPVARERVHYSYLDTLGLHIVRGRNFTAADFNVEDYDGSPDRVVLINETAVKRASTIGIDDPLGQKVGTYRIVGIVNDYKMLGRQKSVEPLLMYLDKPRWERKTPIELASQRRFLIVGFYDEGYSKALSTLKSKFNEIYPEVPFQSVLLADHLARASNDDVRQMTLITVFGCLCILLSAAGLYSLAAFLTEQRAREISIRKVMGATTWQIVVMLCKGLLLMTVVAGIVASVLSYWVVNEWVKGFYYQRHISWLTFCAATALIAIVAVATVALQSRRAALTSPACRLRYD